MSKPSHRRVVYAALTVATMLVGLAVHFHGTLLAASVRDFAGDALWASMIASGISALLPTQPPVRRYAAALCVCYVVEFSQLLHTPTLDQFRATRIGALTLGSGFDARDLLAYAVGIVLFAWLDQRVVLRGGRAQG